MERDVAALTPALDDRATVGSEVRAAAGRADANGSENRQPAEKVDDVARRVVGRDLQLRSRLDVDITAGDIRVGDRYFEGLLDDLGHNLGGHKRGHRDLTLQR